MAFHAASDAPLDDRTFCEVHPTVEATLRCNKCGRYMCSKCSVPTPVGYRCRECVSQQQKVYFTASGRDYVIALAVAGLISIPVGAVIPRLGLFFALILGLPLGGLISEIAMRAVGRRRGRHTWVFIVAGIAIGTLVGVALFDPTIRGIIAIYAEYNSPDYQNLDPQSQAYIQQTMQTLSGYVLTFLAAPLLYIALSVGAVVARMRYGNK